MRNEKDINIIREGEIEKVSEKLMCVVWTIGSRYKMDKARERKRNKGRQSKNRKRKIDKYNNRKREREGGSE